MPKFSIKKLGVLSRAYRHFNRYRQIIVILVKYGFDDVVSMLRIDKLIEIGSRIISTDEKVILEKLTRAERVRLALEELGPTFIKLGQILSSQPGLVPVEFIDELSKLQDDVPPASFEKIVDIFQDEFGKHPEQLFEFIDKKAIASASIGQVYKARLFNGDNVAVKVQRPGIQRVIAIDLEIMLHMATLLEQYIEEMALHSPVKVVEEFARTLGKEIDYSIEAKNIKRFQSQIKGNTDVYVPEVYNDYSSKRILTMEFINGVKISDVRQLDQKGYDKQLIIKRGANLTLSQIFNHGFFHADPHPGNIFVLENSVVCLIDFGMVGVIDRKTREIFVDLIAGIVNEDLSLAAKALLNLTTWEKRPDPRLFEKDIAEFIIKNISEQLQEIEIAVFLKDLLDIVSRYELRIPPDLFLMMKAMATVDGIARQLYPEFDMIKQVKPFLIKISLSRFYPMRVINDLIGVSRTVNHFMQQFPADILEISRLIKNDRLLLKIEHQGYKELFSTIDQVVNRISFSIIIAALLIGSSLIIKADVPPVFMGVSMIGLVGFVFAGILGGWLLIAILRSGRL